MTNIVSTLAVATNTTGIPAGTELNAYVCLYDDSKTNSSTVYAGDYGSYNLIMTKQSGTWYMRIFEMCH